MSLPLLFPFKLMSSSQIIKATYGTWALSRFTQLSSGRVQPVLEIEKIISQSAEHKLNIEKRKLSPKPNVQRVSELYKLASELREKRKKAECLREENAAKVQEMLRGIKDKGLNGDEVKKLREGGRTLRDELRMANSQFNACNDQLIDLLLSIPNSLDPSTPENDTKILRDVKVADGVTPWTNPKLSYEHVPNIGPYGEFGLNSVALLELDLAEKCQHFLLSQNFSETGNVDFVKRVILEGTGLEPEQFLKIREAKVRGSGVAHATYLVGGSSFPAFLALFAQSILSSEENLPVRYFVIGRSYGRSKKCMQESTVQVFVACRDAVEEESEFSSLVEIMEKFYSSSLGLSFHTKIVKAPHLRNYQRKRFEFCNGSKTLGELSSVGDYVSKRLLCCYMDSAKAPKFLHLISGRFMNITHFLRPEEEKKD